MGAQNTLVYDLPTPRRPDLDDVGGGLKENVDDEPPPDPVRDPSAEEDNQKSKLIVAIAKVTPSCRISIAHSGGGYSIESFSACSDNVDDGTFTLAALATGHVQVTWPPLTFPTPVTEPSAFVNGSTPGMIACSGISNGIDIHIATSGGSADLSFSVDIW